MKPIYVEEVIYEFLSSRRKDYGSFNNVVKAVLRKLGDLQESVDLYKSIIDDNDSYVKKVLLESVKNPQSITSYSGVGNKTMNVLPTGPPRAQPIPRDSLQQDLQRVFKVLGEGEPIKPSMFLEAQKDMTFEEKKLTPPPPPIKKESNIPEPDESICLLVSEEEIQDQLPVSDES